MKTDTSSTRDDSSSALFKWLLWAALLLLILAVATYAQQRLDVNQGAKIHDCDLQQGACEFEGFTLSFGPSPIQSLQPMTLELETSEDISFDQVVADLQGADMYMGQNRFSLTPSDENGWQGDTELAVCTTGTMRWRLTLSLTRNGETQQHQFEFDAQ
ncbi:hypothetical protein [Marinobacterium stanieri]|uniref:Uncharacterized protein n=1 Tax=Marinobacterium stanieri TaxID=49186 RepID=A0A1N6Q8B8_9GAMM|nr:hypothetical protein [Marinobacterium stanieri]SIQ12762.1 hypothetical protein SAMN05421647_102333 [Marinobacterium stanieri]